MSDIGRSDSDNALFPAEALLIAVVFLIFINSLRQRGTCDFFILATSVLVFLP